MDMSKYQRYVKLFYSGKGNGWPEHDRWHAHSHDEICRYVRERAGRSLKKGKCKILNCGSGGTDYGLGCDMYHLDILREKIDYFPHWKEGSADDIPFGDHIFDVVICVGSVLDYCNGPVALCEMCRVLKPGGRLILEFENSYSLEYLLERPFGKGIAFAESEYFGEKHFYWVYSLPFVAGILKEQGVVISGLRFIHIAGALVYRLTGNGNIAGWFGRFDEILKSTRLRGYCGNIMLEAHKERKISGYGKNTGKAEG